MPFFRLKLSNPSLSDYPDFYRVKVNRLVVNQSFPEKRKTCLFFLGTKFALPKVGKLMYLLRMRCL